MGMDSVAADPASRNPGTAHLAPPDTQGLLGTGLAPVGAAVEVLAAVEAAVGAAVEVLAPVEVLVYPHASLIDHIQ